MGARRERVSAAKYTAGRVGEPDRSAVARASRQARELLPEPTEREVERHIRERSSEALAALAEARRKAPFLAKWAGLPQPTAKSETIERLNVYRIARREWRTFLKQFDVVTLGYDVR